MLERTTRDDEQDVADPDIRQASVDAIQQPPRARRSAHDAEAKRPHHVDDQAGTVYEVRQPAPVEAPVREREPDPRVPLSGDARDNPARGVEGAGDEISAVVRGEEKRAAGLQHARELFEPCRWVEQVLEDLDRDHEVELGGTEWESFQVRAQELGLDPGSGSGTTRRVAATSRVCGYSESII